MHDAHSIVGDATPDAVGFNCIAGQVVMDGISDSNGEIIL